MTNNVLTKRQKTILEFYKLCGFNWFVITKNGIGFFYPSKPFKDMGNEWRGFGDPLRDYHQYITGTPFMNPEDFEEPINISELLEEKDTQLEETDWSKVPIDTPVEYRPSLYHDWRNGCFAGMVEGLPCVFPEGRTSFTVKDISEDPFYPYMMKLYEGDDK